SVCVDLYCCELIVLNSVPWLEQILRACASTRLLPWLMPERWDAASGKNDGLAIAELNHVRPPNSSSKRDLPRHSLQPESGGFHEQSAMPGRDAGRRCFA